MLKKFKLQHCLSMLVACFTAIPYCFMNVPEGVIQALDEAELVSTLLQPGELSRIEEGDSLVYLSSRVIQALTDVAVHAKEQAMPVQAVQDVLGRIKFGYHTAGNAETLLAIKSASLYAAEQNISDVTDVLAEYETALARGDASFVSKRSCPPLLKKECLEVANLCVKNSCILGNEKILGSLNVGGSINLTNDCPCCACKSNVIGTVSGAFHPGAQVIDARINLNVDFDFPDVAPFPFDPDEPDSGLQQGCFEVDNPFKDATACVVGRKSGLEVLEASISGIKGIVLLDDTQRIQFATEFTVVVGYPSFSEPPVVVFDYNSQQQGTALYSLVNLPLLATTLYNVFLSSANVQQSYAVIKAIFVFEATAAIDFEAIEAYPQILLFLKEVINSSSLSVRLFGFHGK